MKNIFCTAILCLFMIGSFSCFYNDKDISIHVNDTNEHYEFKASYPKGETGRVQDYINESMAPNGLFSSTHDYLNVYTELKDRTKFHVKSSPGRMDIELNKDENSIESYNRIKSMCEGIKNILTKK